MGCFDNRDVSSLPSIPEFYSGKTIFITGGSGFMGLTLIEKLLYSCSDLNKIYVLLRCKKGLIAENRLRAMYDSPVFERLKKEKPDIFKQKMYFVGGDVTKDSLGLSDEDRESLAKETDIIFHVAASVRFDDSLPYAVNMNLQGTIEVLKLAKQMKNLCALIHVSTCYSNCNRYYVEEKMYPPLADWRETLEICSEVNQQTIDVFTRKLLGEMPNTYVFTKQLAEQVVYEHRDQLPLVLIRPSIVICSLDEPFPGWVNNFNGPTGILVACSKGIMRSIYARGDLITDFIPVDISIKNFIAAAWLRGTKKSAERVCRISAQSMDNCLISMHQNTETVSVFGLIKTLDLCDTDLPRFEPSDDLQIYNCAANKILEIRLQEIVDVGKMVNNEYPLNDILWTPGFSITTSKTYHYVKVMLLQVLPALFVDFILWLFGKNTLLLKIQRRIYQASISLRYFQTNEWKFNNDNFVALRSCIKEEDKKQFCYEFNATDKYELFVKCNLGGRRCLLKDDNIEGARNINFKYWILDMLIKLIFFGYLLWRIYSTTYVQSYLKPIN